MAIVLSLIHTLHSSLQHRLVSRRSSVSSVVAWWQLQTIASSAFGFMSLMAADSQLTRYKGWFYISTRGNCLSRLMLVCVPADFLNSAQIGLCFYSPSIASARINREDTYPRFLCCVVLVQTWHLEVFFCCMQAWSWSCDLVTMHVLFFVGLHNLSSSGDLTEQWQNFLALREVNMGERNWRTSSS